MQLYTIHSVLSHRNLVTVNRILVLHVCLCFGYAHRVHLYFLFEYFSIWTIIVLSTSYFTGIYLVHMHRRPCLIFIRKIFILQCSVYKGTKLLHEPCETDQKSFVVGFTSQVMYYRRNRQFSTNGFL